MSMPVLTVEIALTNNPTDVAVWTDVTAYTWQVATRRGRQMELDRIEAGTASITLDNRDRRFDPTFAAGPYYGQLLPMRRVLISAVWNSITYPLFYGYVEGWPQKYDSAMESTVEISAVDGFKLLSRAILTVDLPVQRTDERVDTLLALAGWTLGDSWVFGATAANSKFPVVFGPNGDRALARGYASMAEDSLVKIDALSAIMDATDVELGQTYCDRRGKFVFQDRYYRNDDLTPLAVIGDGAGEFPYSSIEVLWDDSHIINTYTATTADNIEATASDMPSKLKYFTCAVTSSSLPLGVQVGEPSVQQQLQSRADYMVRRYKEPQLRFGTITFPFAQPDSNWPVTLNMGIGDRITVRRRPMGGTMISQDCHLEHIEHTITAGANDRDWQTTWQVSPVDPVSYWLMGVAGRSTFTNAPNTTVRFGW